MAKKLTELENELPRRSAERDAAYIADLALKQSATGAAWLDVNAGTHPSQEPDDLIWLIETVQAVVDTPLCLDSANPNALRIAIRAAKQTPMINSISGEVERLKGILPIVAENGCPVIALAMDGKKIHESADLRFEVIQKLVEETRRNGVPDSSLYIDPLAMTVSTNTQSAQIAFEVMRRVRQEFPLSHLTIGLSNISFGLPSRSIVNRYFLSYALMAGLDSAILDPLDRDIQAAILASDLLLGKDPHCLNFIRASRKGLFEKPAD